MLSPQIPLKPGVLLKKHFGQIKIPAFTFCSMKLFINDLEYLGYFLIVFSVLLKMGPRVVRHTLHLVHA